MDAELQQVQSQIRLMITEQQRKLRDLGPTNPYRQRDEGVLAGLEQALSIATRSYG